MGWLFGGETPNYIIVFMMVIIGGVCFVNFVGIATAFLVIIAAEVTISYELIQDYVNSRFESVDAWWQDFSENKLPIIIEEAEKGWD